MPDNDAKNPFSVSFGRLPAELIMRPEEYDKIITTFTGLPVTDQIYIITGLRGSGKTVLFTSVIKELKSREDWIVIQLNTYDDMSEAFYSELYYALKAYGVSVTAEFGIPEIARVSLTSNAPRRTTSSLIRELLKSAEKRQKNVLVAVDDISKSSEIKRFLKTFQGLISEDLPLYFLGTGTTENIDELQNAKDLTFLYRAPRITLKPLDMADIADRYQKTFDLEAAEAAAMSKLTKGYAFAFQALGYIYWDQMPVKELASVLPDYDRILTRAAYSKMWSELSGKDKEVCRAIAAADDDKVSSIRKIASMSPSLFSTYRMRLSEKGLIDTSAYGRITFTVPRFCEFVRDRSLLYD